MDIILGKWRKAISLVKVDGQFYLCRFDKRLRMWRKVLYFATQDDYEDFLEFLDKSVPEPVEVAGEGIAPMPVGGGNVG